MQSFENEQQCFEFYSAFNWNKCTRPSFKTRFVESSLNAVRDEMDFLVLMFLYLVLSSMCTLCYIHADAPLLKKGPVGSLRTSLSKAFLSLWKVLPQPIKTHTTKIFDNIFFERNCLFQLLYAVLVALGHVVLVVDGLPYLYAMQPGGHHLLEPVTLLLINALLFVVCCRSDPGVIRAANLDRYSRVFPADGVMYKEGNECRTCHIVKPARSKHCAIFNACIFKFDHYCAWTNNAVGGLNHRYFLLFLLSLCAMCADGVCLAFAALTELARFQQLGLLMYLDDSGKPQPMNFRVLTQTLFMQMPRLVFLCVSLAVMTTFLSAFTLYHVYLVLTNQTTNERYKRHDLKASRPPGRVLANPYDGGAWQNIQEEFLPLRTISYCREHKWR